MGYDGNQGVMFKESVCCFKCHRCLPKEFAHSSTFLKLSKKAVTDSDKGNLSFKD